MKNQIEAKHGQRMIEVKIRFWTDNIADKKGYIVPKHAWSHGVVRIEPNESHGIVARNNPIPFNSLLDVGAAVEKVLIANGIVLRPSRKMQKYMTDKV